MEEPDDIEDNTPHVPQFGDINDDDIYDDFEPIYYNITNNITPINDIIPLEITTDDELDELEPADPTHLYAPPTGFDMNMASVVEDNQDLVDNLNNAQVEYDGNWYFALHGQVYSVPYEIEIDDIHVRRDIVANWDDVRWAGSIEGFDVEEDIGVWPIVVTEYNIRGVGDGVVLHPLVHGSLASVAATFSRNT
jgi:hypothetical protein